MAGRARGAAAVGRRGARGPGRREARAGTTDVEAEDAAQPAQLARDADQPAHAHHQADAGIEHPQPMHEAQPDRRQPQSPTPVAPRARVHHPGDHVHAPRCPCPSTQSGRGPPKRRLVDGACPGPTTPLHPPSTRCAPPHTPAPAEPLHEPSAEDASGPAQPPRPPRRRARRGSRSSPAPPVRCRSAQRTSPRAAQHVARLAPSSPCACDAVAARHR